MMELVLVLVIFTGLEGQPIKVNPEQVVSIRSPRESTLRSGEIAPGVNCLIQTTDGKFIAVQEDCDTVQRRLMRHRRP